MLLLLYCDPNTFDGTINEASNRRFEKKKEFIIRSISHNSKLKQLMEIKFKTWIKRKSKFLNIFIEFFT